MIVRAEFLTNPRMELYLNLDRLEGLTIRTRDSIAPLEIFRGKLNGVESVCLKRTGSAFSSPAYLGKESFVGFMGASSLFSIIRET